MIAVELSRSIMDTLEAKVDLELLTLNNAMSHLVVAAFDDAGREEVGEVEAVVTGIYRSLAALGLEGEIHLFDEGAVFTAEEWENEVLSVVENVYGTRTPTITQDDVVRVLQEEDDAAAVGKGLERLARSMKEEGLARGLNKEERERMTLGEAYSPPDET